MSARVDPIVEEERQHDLFQVRILGVSAWRLVRVPVLETILANRRDLGRSNHNRLDLRRLPWIALGVVRSLAHLARIRRRPYLILGFPRRRLEDGKWVDPFSDPLIDCLGPEKVLCIEKPFAGEHDLPQKTKGIVHYDWITAISLALSFVFGPFVWLTCSRRIAELTRRVNRLGRVSPRRFGLMVARAVATFWIERAFAAVILASVQPRAVLLTMRRHHHPLIHACKARGIPVFELQHGAIAPGGFKYSSPTDARLDPDFFLTFGEFWSSSDWGLPDSAVQAIGFKYIADKRREESDAAGSMQGPDKVMLVSQPHVWRLLDAAFNAIVTAYPQTSFILKLHPQDVDGWATRYSFARAANVATVAGQEPDLYTLFRQCKCVCGYDSTVLFEAAFLGVKTAILNAEGDNPCSALEFAGRFNFHELTRPEQLETLIGGGARPAECGDSPFFGNFERERFLRLVGAMA